jgi:hypothetical protein
VAHTRSRRGAGGEEQAAAVAMANTAAMLMDSGKAPAWLQQMSAPQAVRAEVPMVESEALPDLESRGVTEQQESQEREVQLEQQEREQQEREWRRLAEQYEEQHPAPSSEEEREVEAAELQLEEAAEGGYRIHHIVHADVASGAAKVAARASRFSGFGQR